MEQEVAQKKPTPGALAVATQEIGHAISSEKLFAVSAHFGVNTDNLDELARIGSESMNRALYEIAKAGVAFMLVQQQLSEHSDTGFTAWIEQHGMARQRVYEAIRVAKFAAQLPESELAKVLQLGKVKVTLLASIPQDVIDNAAESGSSLIEKADLMTVAELKAEIKDLKKRENNYEAELERKDSVIKRLSDDKKRTTEFLLRTEEIREECMAHQLGVELPLNSLQMLFQEVYAEDAALPERRLQLEQIWVAAHIAASRALDVLAFMKDLASEDEMPTRVMADHVLQPAEAERWLMDAKVIENRSAAEAALRQEQREASKPRGPGRPKASGSKAGK